MDFPDENVLARLIFRRPLGVMAGDCGRAVSENPRDFLESPTFRQKFRCQRVPETMGVRTLDAGKLEHGSQCPPCPFDEAAQIGRIFGKESPIVLGGRFRVRQKLKRLQHRGRQFNPNPTVVLNSMFLQPGATDVVSR